MEGSIAHPLAGRPSRPTRPPFPPNARPVQNGPLSPPGPSNQERRPAQGYRPAPDQTQEQTLGEQRQGAGARPQGRDYWRRRPRNGPFNPHEPRDDKMCERMVEVHGFPPYTRPQDLIHTFSDFGTAKVDKMFEHAAVLRFSDSEEAAEALRASKNVWLYGECLAVGPYTKAIEQALNAKNYRNKQKGPTVDPSTLSWEGDFHAQLDGLLKAVRLSPQEIHQLTALYHDLDSVLQGTWPGCLTIPFGSVTTGLGVKASDADCFVLLPGAAARAPAVPRARRALAQHPRLFASLVAIPNANTPIVKFFHVPTRTHCDVSFKTLLGVQNSKLIGYLLHADPRVLPLAVVIKYWAAVHELSGTGRLTNYALTMMLIFYLQQLPQPLLPSVAWLQRDPAAAHLVDGWNTGFMSDPARLPRPANTSSIPDLLGGFFAFYSQLDMKQFIVCPYLGCCVTKQTFTQLDSLPPDFARYKTNVRSGAALPLRVSTPMCVQDPFEQSHNVASSVTTRLFAEIGLYIKFAADAYEREKAGGCKNYLKTILLERPAMPRAKSKGKAEFRTGIRPHILNNINNEDWREPCDSVIKCIFKELLQIGLERVPKAGPAAPPAPDAPGKRRVRYKYAGTLTRAVWKRKKFSKLYSAMKHKFYDQEQMITKEILATDATEYNVEFQLIATFTSSPRFASLIIRPTAGNLQTFKEFGRFFEDNMTHWFSVLIKSWYDKSMPDKSLPTSDNEQKKLDTDDSDSDSDSSTEDERKPEVQLIDAQEDADTQKSDRENSPSDADKENIEEVVNIDGKTAAEETHKNLSDGDSGRTPSRRRKNNKKNNVKKSAPQPAVRDGQDKR